MNTRILVAGVLGGIVMFIWSSIAHMALPLGKAGIREIPNEQSLITAMQSNIGDKSGLYIFLVSVSARTRLANKRMKR